MITSFLRGFSVLMLLVSTVSLADEQPGFVAPIFMCDGPYVIEAGKDSGFTVEIIGYNNRIKDPNAAQETYMTDVRVTVRLLNRETQKIDNVMDFLFKDRPLTVKRSEDGKATSFEITAKGMGEEDLVLTAPTGAKQVAVIKTKDSGQIMEQLKELTCTLLMDN